MDELEGKLSNEGEQLSLEFTCELRSLLEGNPRVLHSLADRDFQIFIQE